MAHAQGFDDALLLFLTAARCGDLPAVQHSLDLPTVRENVALSNAIHRANRLGEPGPYLNEAPREGALSTRRAAQVLKSSIEESREVELLQFLFAREQLELFGETLRAAAENKLKRSIVDEDYTASREIFEIVVTSALFQEVMDDSERLQLLGRMLNMAAFYGCHWWVGALLGYGADPNVSIGGETPLMAIGHQGNYKTLDRLLAHGARIEAKEMLQQLAYNRSGALLGEMLCRGADANAPVDRTGSVLHQAARYSCVEAAQHLIDEGFADIDARDARGRTPLMVVAGEALPDHAGGALRHQIMRLLIERGASVDAVDDEGSSVLHYVMRTDSDECVRMCLARGADPNLRDANGQTPMDALLRPTEYEEFGREIW